MTRSQHPPNPISHHLFPLALLAIAALLQAMGKDMIGLLRYERQAILEGEIWRLLTAHLVHLGWRHLLLNGVGLGLIWLLLRATWSQPRWLLIWLLTALGVSLGQLLFSPELKWVVGLSGTLHGLFAAGAIAMLWQGEKTGMIMLLVLVAKLAWEQFASPMPGSAEWVGGAVITSAHLYGAVSGAVSALMLLTLRGTSAGKR